MLATHGSVYPTCLQLHPSGKDLDNTMSCTYTRPVLPIKFNSTGKPVRYLYPNVYG